MRAGRGFKDYYKILGLDVTASFAEIQAAFRRLAKKHHPDLSKAKDAETRMKLINEAYDVLRDPQKRATYDIFYQLNQLRRTTQASQAGFHQTRPGPPPPRPSQQRSSQSNNAADSAQPGEQRSTRSTTTSRRFATNPVLVNALLFILIPVVIAFAIVSLQQVAANLMLLFGIISFISFLFTVSDEIHSWLKKPEAHSGSSTSGRRKRYSNASSWRPPSSRKTPSGNGQRPIRY
jgi:curved DNA-binding protein CbpA